MIVQCRRTILLFAYNYIIISFGLEIRCTINSSLRSLSSCVSIDRGNVDEGRDSNGRRGLRLDPWCNKFGVRLAGVGSLTRASMPANVGRQEERRRGRRLRRRGSVVRGCPSERHTLDVGTPSSKDA